MPISTRPTSFSSTGVPLFTATTTLPISSGVTDAADAGHVIELAALRIEAAAGIGIVGGQRGFHLRHRQAGAGHFGGIEQHLILHVAAAEAGIVRHAGHRAIGRLDDPVFKGLQLHRRAVGALQHIAVDQARRATTWARSTA